MRPRLLALALLIALAAPAAAVCAQTRDCASPEPTAADLEAGAALPLASAAHARANRVNSGPLTIHVAFHVITNGTTGDLPQARIDAQMAQWNADYAPVGLHFVLDSVDRTNDSRYFGMTQGSTAERSAKSALAIDPLHKVNVYTFGASGTVLGWAYLPWTYPENDTRHGVVIRWDTLPGVVPGPFDMGRTLTHEAGHYFGLLHTFQGGCNVPGDQIDDTPYEAAATRGCPTPDPDTCPAPGLDPIHDFMDYTDDACMSEFTPDQCDRMQASLAQYRSHLVATVTAVAPPLAPRALELRAPYPSPARGEAACMLRLPQAAFVRVTLHDVAGQRVATLAERWCDAGETRVAIPTVALAPGTYFVRASSAGAAAAARALVVLR